MLRTRRYRRVWRSVCVDNITSESRSEGQELTGSRRRSHPRSAPRRPARVPDTAAEEESPSCGRQVRGGRWRVRDGRRRDGAIGRVGDGARDPHRGDGRVNPAQMAASILRRLASEETLLLDIQREQGEQEQRFFERRRASVDEKKDFFDRLNASRLLKETEDDERRLDCKDECKDESKMNKNAGKSQEVGTRRGTRDRTGTNGFPSGAAAGAGG